MLKHRLTSYILVAGMALAGCTDKSLLDDERTPSDAVTFSALACGSVPSEATSRSAREEFEPLELSDQQGETGLYLHTYESERIGDDPARAAAEAASRGVEVETPDALLKFHSNFKVNATYPSGEEYISWTDTRCKGSENAEKNIWLTQRTEYWPGERDLNFHALSPSSEFENARGMVAGENSLSFSYTARKGAEGADAEAQPDLLVATAVCNKATSDRGRAPLKFHHALAAVKFAVRDVLAGEIVSVAISGVHSTATCSYTYDPESGLGSFDWTGQTGTETYTQRFGYAVDDRYGATEDDDLILNNKMPEKTFMMIPQEIPDDAEIIVTVKQTGIEGTKVLRGKIKANNVEQWKAGHEYIYTISTSKDNWVYVFTATGNHRISDNAHNVDGDEIYVYSPSEKAHDTYRDLAYFKVTSYRYRANRHDIIEHLPWSASHGAGKQYRLGGEMMGYVQNRDLTPEEWITDPLKLRGSGSTAPERHDLSFAAHHQITTWLGDSLMQHTEPYEGNSKTTPWDLSTCNSKIPRNTANCYVIDREGWYCLPLYYGNAVTDGSVKSDRFNNDVFRNHADATISSLNGKISETEASSARVVWADVYNVVSEASLTTVYGEKMVLFHANKNNMQQGNIIIAVCNDKDEVMWSWHIWVTEHWLHPTTGVNHALSTKYGLDTSEFAYKANLNNHWRLRGDLQLNSTHVSGPWLSPYNLGWCDPKDVDYLQRRNTMAFVQYLPDGTTASGLTASLPIIQDGAHLNYKFGNNTYYQWGRKDPMVGFVNHDNEKKRNFGDTQYSEVAQPQKQSYGILHPELMFCKFKYVRVYLPNGKIDTENTQDKPDWCDTSSDLYWNLGSQENVRKTVYDPSPAGYKMPHAKVFQIVGMADDGTYKNQGSTTKSPIKNLNGQQEDTYTFRIDCGNNTAAPDETSFWFTATGNRWYSDGWETLLKNVKGGDNFNPQICYLWATDAADKTSCYSLAIGKDTNDENDKNEWVICAYFGGRRAMGRAVRPIRE